MDAFKNINLSKIQSGLQSSIQSVDIQSVQSSFSSFTPFARRTTQWAKERIGASDVEKTELPQEYLDLERRVDALKAVHQKLLGITSTYANEGYDYPVHLKESFTDFSKQVQDKFQSLSQAHTAAEAQAALVKAGPKGQPKTLAHALARAAYASADLLGTSDPFGAALSKVADAEEKVGEARLQQDDLIHSRFNATLNTALSINLQFAARARKSVQNARLTLDAAKASARSAKPERADAARVEIEQAEDNFVAAVEEASGVMKNVLDSQEATGALQQLVQAQLDYHKQAAEVLSGIVGEIEAPTPAFSKADEAVDVEVAAEGIAST